MNEMWSVSFNTRRLKLIPVITCRGHFYNKNRHDHTFESSKSQKNSIKEFPWIFRTSVVSRILHCYPNMRSRGAWQGSNFPNSILQNIHNVRRIATVMRRQTESLLIGSPEGTFGKFHAKQFARMWCRHFAAFNPVLRIQYTDET